MEPVLASSGRKEKRQPHSCSKTIVTARSATLPADQAWRALVGRPAFAWVVTVKLAGTICSAVSGDITFCFTTTEMVPLPTSPAKPVFSTKWSAGGPAARFWTTTATGILIYSFATTSSSILLKLLLPMDLLVANGGESP